ncbi:MAG: hypothetical protein ACRCW2_02515 [Cellulosilyticaceae bacterium]
MSSYLGTGVGTRIIPTANQLVKSHHAQLLTRVDDVYYHDISLDPSLHVILATTSDHSHKVASLGTHHSINQAILTAQQSLLQKISPTEYLDWAIDDEDYYFMHFLRRSAYEIGQPAGYLAHAKVRTNRSYLFKRSFRLANTLKLLKQNHNIEPYITRTTAGISHIQPNKITVFLPHWIPYAMPTSTTEPVAPPTNKQFQNQARNAVAIFYTPLNT